MIRKIKYSLTVLATLILFQVNAQQTAKITSSGIGYLEYLPQGYSSNTNKYPLVISLHGIGERGTTSTDPATLKASVLKVANVGIPKYIKYGQQYPFIMIAPQLKSSYGTWPATYVMEVLNYVKKYLRVDDRKIYITGLSLGGGGVWRTIGAYPGVFAAAVPVCSGYNALSQACGIASNNVAVWGFHGTSDGVVSYTVTTKMVNAINACTPKPSPLAKYTLFSGLGHNIWDKVYKETNAINWMLSFINGSTTTTPTESGTTTNANPVANAGSDISKVLPANSATIYGSAQDSDGTIASYAWSQVSGPSTASLANKTSSNMTASAMVAGTYTFRLKVTDNKGGYDTDDVQVKISTSTTTGNVAPSVSAGSDQSITLPTNSISLQGTATDSDGSIASYTWTKIQGPSVPMSGITTSKLYVSTMFSGTYIFRLTVKDNKGSVKYDDVTVYVKNATTNIAPIVYAGEDKTTTGSEIYLYGKATDADGIASYTWAKISGNSCSLSGTTTTKLRAYNLPNGTYIFRLTSKDKTGKTAYDDVTVVVK